MRKSMWPARALGMLACVFALVGPGTTPADADGAVSTSFIPGSGHPMAMGARPGEMGFFDAVVQQYNASGERFRIDGHCQSACTMFLSIRNVCITQNANLLFHAGGDRRSGRFSVAATQHMLSAYKPALSAYVTEHHFMDTFEFHAIPGRDMISRFGYPACR